LSTPRLNTKRSIVTKAKLSADTQSALCVSSSPPTRFNIGDASYGPHPLTHSTKKKSSTNESNGDEKDASSQLIGVTFLFISLCFDGGTGAYEDKLMSVHSVGPFDLMYNIQLGKTILAGIGLIVLNQVHVFARMCQDMGFLLVALGLSGAIGQVFIFVTIAKFGALTCAIIGLARKVATLVASIYFYGHSLNKVQAAGLCLAIGAMVNDFFGKKGGGKGGHGHGHGGEGAKESTTANLSEEERRPILSAVEEEEDDENNDNTAESSSSSIELGRLDKK
jgi:UDP-galactose transporter B1